ncbi:MAG TPA: choice-of-anchor D domain-containing protein [Tenuifilaceae bacterium]|nr:choice-of-anchor D domain-containing protein [Tenuifilaceae bacterium]
MKDIKWYVSITFLLILFNSLGVGLLAQDEGWTVVSQWPVNNSASGLAYDGTYFYIGTYGSNGGDVYRFDPTTGTNTLLFTGPHSYAYGLTYDGEYLWTIDQPSSSSSPAFAMKLDMNGGSLAQFNLPMHYMSGIAWDNGNFWVATYYPDPGIIHEVDDQGNQLSSFVPPANQPWDLAVQGDSLWIIDYWNNVIDVVLKDGTPVESFPYTDYRASGIWHDGTFLWYIGRASSGASTLYKVNPWGGGTPVISVPTTHDFGNVTLSETATWNIQIGNNGTGTLEISDITFSGDNTFYVEETDFPYSVDVGGSVTLTIVFEPNSIAEYVESMTIHSNDPANPEKVIELRGAGLFDGAYITGVQESIDFGIVRMNSTSRKYLHVKNMGNINLVLDSMNFSSDYFFRDESVALPLTVSPVQSVELPIWFWPKNAGGINETLTLTFNNDEQSPLDVEVKGNADNTSLALGDIIWEHQFTGTSEYNPRAIMPLADITGDGVQEVVVGTRDHMISLFNGNSSGSPDLLWESEVGIVEYAKGIGCLDDINDDDTPDIVVGTAWGDRTVTALSGKTGEILWRFYTNQYGSGGWVYMVSVKYDYNDDGFMDVLAATGDDGYNTGPRRVFLLNGKNGQKLWDAFLNASVYSVLSIDDINGDGVPDVLAGATSPDEKGMVYALNGINGNVIWQKETAGSAVWALEQIDDITDDGVADVIVGTFNGVYYLLDATNGQIEAQGSLGSSIILNFWIAGDLNGDGYVDVLPAHSTVKNVVAISGFDGQILWSTPVSDQPWSIIPLNDISGDGIPDLAVGTLYMQNNLYFIEGAEGDILKTIPMTGAVDVIMSVADITGDYSMEVVTGTRDGKLKVFSGGLDAAVPHWDVTFHVTNADTPTNNLQDATVVIIEIAESDQTDEDGMVVFSLTDGNYTYTVSKEGYFSAEGNFTVDGESLLVEVELIVDNTGVTVLPHSQLLRAYCYPNPMSTSTNITFTLTQDEPVKVLIYDVNGSVIRVFESQMYYAGENHLIWDGRNQRGGVVSNGMYFFELITPNKSFRDRILILRD